MEQSSLVRFSRFAQDSTLPAIYEPSTPGILLSAWARENRDSIRAMLHRDGGILFRGFGLDSNRFQEFVDVLCQERLHYQEGATPRSRVGEKLYTSTEYPAEHCIALHNELSYVTQWPLHIWFYCDVPPQSGGETPVADVRKVFQRLRPGSVRRFIERKWLLVRNYGEGIGLPWEQVFRTSDRATVEAYCAASDIQMQWKPGNRLRTWQVRPAVAQHPVTLESLWFNHIGFWHVSSLPPEVRAALLSVMGEQDLPFNVYYGDGSPIEEEILSEIRAAYDAETVVFSWKAGDVLMLDNMLVAHGRNAYAGARRILVAMGDPCSSRGVVAPD